MAHVIDKLASLSGHSSCRATRSVAVSLAMVITSVTGEILVEQSSTRPPEPPDPPDPPDLLQPSPPSSILSIRRSFQSHAAMSTDLLPISQFAPSPALDFTRHGWPLSSSPEIGTASDQAPFLLLRRIPYSPLHTNNIWAWSNKSYEIFGPLRSHVAHHPIQLSPFTFILLSLFLRKSNVTAYLWMLSLAIFSLRERPNTSSLISLRVVILLRSKSCEKLNPFDPR